MKQLLLLTFIVLSFTAGAQTKVPTFEELEKKEQACAEAANENAVRDCYAELAKQYEIILNDVYKKLIAAVTATEKTVIVDAEKKWIAYKDSDIALRTKVAIAHGNTGYLRGRI